MQYYFHGFVNAALTRMSIGRLLTKVDRLRLSMIGGGLLLLGCSSFGGPLQLLSVRDSAVAPPAGGNGDSVAPRISNDGRFIVFSSSASDLATNGVGQFKLNVFLHDRASNVTTMVSVNYADAGGGNGNSSAGQVSSNGQFVAFQSEASDLLPGDTNGVSDIFVRDLQAGTNTLVSVAADGGWASGASTEPVMTPDGRWVAFVSAATNLVSGETNGTAGLFVRDVVNGTTKRVCLGGAGASVDVATPVLTPDGRYVAFFSTATNLVPGVPTATKGEVYLAEVASNTITWASTNAALAAYDVLLLNNTPSSHPALSDDGRYVAFKTGWTNGAVSPGGSSPAAVIFFVYDSLTGTSTILSTNGFPPWANCDDVYGPEMTPDGRFIAYVEREFAGTTNYSSVRLWDQQSGTNVLVSAGPDGLWPTNSTSHTPAVSQDGRYVTFLSDATNLVSNLVSNGLHIYRRDLQTSATVLVDADTSGVGSLDELGVIPSLSADGSCLVFATQDGGLVGSDSNNASDVFLWSAAAGTNALISVRQPEASVQSGNAMSSLGQVSLSADGRLAAFASFASDLAPGDFNQDCDVFVRDLTSGSNCLVSAGPDGNSGQGGGSYSPVISANGRYVVFISSATNLVAGDTNLASDVFRRDLQTGVTVRVSASTNGASLSAFDCSMAVCSQDGRYVAFLCRTNASITTTNVFWRDMNSGVIRVVSGSAHPSQPISISADGQRVAYFNSSAWLYIWSASSLGNIYSKTSAGLTSAVISPTGSQLLYLAANQLFVYDLVSASNLFLYAQQRPNQERVAMERGRPLCGLRHGHQPRGWRQQRDQRRLSPRSADRDRYPGQPQSHRQWQRRRPFRFAGG